MNIRFLFTQRKKSWLVVLSILPLLANTYSLLSDGIFDISQTRTMTSKIEFNTENSGGIGTYKTEAVTPNQLKVSYTFERKDTPNPLIVVYDFEIRKMDTGDYEMDMKGAMPFMSMYISENIKTVYEGKHVIYPKTLTVGKKLEDAEGVFQLKNKETHKLLLAYEVAITNRKILETETIHLEGKDYTAYLHTYNFEQKTILNTGKKLSTLQEKVSEWLIPNYGIVKQDRTGTLTTPTSETELNTSLPLSSSSQILTIR